MKPRPPEHAESGPRLQRRRAYGWLRLTISFGAFFLLVGLVALGWYALRPHPEPVQGRPLFQGVTHTRTVHSDPPQVVNLITVDLTAPGLRWRVTPRAYEGEQPYGGLTTGDFLDRHGLQVAVNGGFFEPFYSKWPWDYYPKTGEPVTVLGLSVSGGDVHTPHHRGYGTFYVSKAGRVEIADTPPWPMSQVEHAISGREIMVRDGQLVQKAQRISRPEERHPRTAVGIDAERKRVFLLVVDGRQWRYAAGFTVAEIGEALIEAGAHTALLLDGGGSTTMAVMGDEGEAELLNTPAHTRIPGRQRPVANHLGLYARPLDAAP
ncbi:MAG: phosphodiester glycosidase family protein [Bradymonadia bacterium]